MRPQPFDPVIHFDLNAPIERIEWSTLHGSWIADHGEWSEFISEDAALAKVRELKAANQPNPAHQ